MARVEIWIVEAVYCSTGVVHMRSIFEVQSDAIRCRDSMRNLGYVVHAWELSTGRKIT